MAKHGLIGAPPPGLVAVPAGAVQFSPLVPGASVLEEVAPESLDSMIVAAPPGTIERRYLCALALRALSVAGTLTVLAPRNRGGLRLADELVSFGAAPEEETRAHYRLCRATRPDLLTGIEAALTEGGPRYEAALGLWTQPGIFSWDRIDPGSRLLAEHLPSLSGRGADLGCGTGYLARTVLAGPTAVALALVDLDRRAIEAARRNVDDPRAIFLWADAARPLPLEALDFVVTNPPFHRDGMEDRALGVAVAAEAARILKPGGLLCLVANRHLPYAPALRDRFGQVEVIADDRQYRVYRARR